MEEKVKETEYCSNCQRDIPAANFVMHVTHCQRNLTLCKVCGEPVPTSQQEEHFEENHAEVKCDCGQRVEKMNLEEHKEKDCPSRLVDCQYCELQLPFSELSSHVEYCGSRTEKCDKCDRFVQNKDFEEHINTGCQYPVKEEKKKLPPKMPNESFSEMPLGMLHAMGLMDSSASHPNRDNYFPFMAGMREFGRIINSGLGTPPFSDASYFGDIDAAEAGRDGRDVVARGARGYVGFQKPTFYQRNFEDFENTDSDYATAQTDDDEMLAAAYQVDEFDRANGTDGTSSGMVDEPFANAQPSPMSDLENDTTKLPCEFCGNLFPMDALILHQSGCQLRSLDSVSGSAPSVFPVDNRKHDLLHMNNSTVSTHGAAEFLEDHTELEAEDTKGLDVTFLPCEFCQELFPFDNLIAHQAVCDACPPSLPPPILQSGSAPVSPLNNARPAVRNGSQSRPSRPVYESKRIQKSIENFIPSELDDSSPDLDLTPRDVGRKPEEYKYGIEGGERAAMNNELQRAERQTTDDRSLRGQTVLRNNDFADRQPSKDIPRVKNRTINPPAKRQSELKTGLSGTGYKAPAAKPMEEGISRKKLTAGARSKPAAELFKLVNAPRARDSSSRIRPQQSSVTEATTERSKGDLDTKMAMQIPKVDTQLRKLPSAARSTASRSSRTKLPDPPQGVGNSDTPSAARSTAPRSSRTKRSDTLQGVIHSSASPTHSASSNPRRNPPTMTSEVVRSNRGRPRLQQDGSSESRTSSTQTSAPPRRKKIV